MRLGIIVALVIYPKTCYMKKLSYLLGLSIVFAACNNSSTAGEAEKTDSLVNGIRTAESHFCFESFNGKDKISLQYDLVGDDISGDLMYAIDGKDRNEGTVQGTLNGDTLLLDYMFQSEGELSSRQVAFLKRDSLLVEGYGNSEERDGKLEFTDRAELKFGAGVQLRRVNCKDESSTAPAAPASAAAATPTQQGSEILYMFRWELTELGETVIAQDKRPLVFLLFSPGEKGRVSGKGGCNRLSGSFELKGTSGMSFGPLAATKMACEEMELETRFLKALDEVDTWKVIDNVLFLSKGATKIAAFQSVANK